MFVRILVVFLAVSGATQAVDEIPEVCGLDIGISAFLYILDLLPFFP